MKILISNDDGIDSRGIRELAEALASIDDTEIYVSAPQFQQSAMSHSISMRNAMQIKDVEFRHAKRAMMIDGTPADCVMLGVRYLHSQGVDIDIVYAGINEGSNLGTDTLYSGTVGAAMEGALCGKPSIAVSVANHSPSNFKAAADLAKAVYPKVLEKMDPGTIININTPDLPPEEIKGLKITRTGRRDYSEWFTATKNEEGIDEYRYAGDPIIYSSKDKTIDVIAVQEGYASITPLMFDLTEYNKMKEIAEWDLKLD